MRLNAKYWIASAKLCILNAKFYIANAKLCVTNKQNA